MADFPRGSTLHRFMASLRSFPLLVLAVWLALPVLALLAAWWPWGSQASASVAVLRDMTTTVLPGYVGTTAWLALWVGIGAAVVGTATAATVTLFEFPGRRQWEWLLLLPLAMPAYVTAYAYTDFLQFSGPLQVWLRESFALEGRLLPEVRSVWGAIWVFIFALYPYVYLLARTALSERAAHLMEAARLLGAPLPRRIATIALPLARPAVAAGVALVLMETLADFGVTSYFGIQTFTTGIIKAWLSLDNRLAAAQLATMLLAMVLLLLWLEHRAQQRMRFTAKGVGRAGSAEAQPVALRGASLVLAWVICAVPVLMGFFAPVAFMLRPLASDWSVLPWERFLEWAWNSVRLGGITAGLAVAVALALAFAVRRRPDALTRGVVQLASLGYAVPGAVVVVGLLLPVGWLQAAWPSLGLGAVLTTTAVGIVWAYLVRFCAVALQSVQSGYARIPPSLDDSARMLGAGSPRLLLQVHWPLLQRSTAAAALLVFVDVMKELPATMVLRPFNSDTLAVVAYQLARDERLGEAALPSLALVAVGLVPVILLSRTLRARESSSYAC
ncbi:ABC transporter permease [Giesbergeria anulus]|uniref:Iron(III) transport system permease protein n=1 Tax=Giesbergeria anulus TaxID=180197 RepID=A0A1H9SH58_9BURK|nr:iron ABC transporter permease [Giesbergeria anulus]SER83713.1 iron(III) transport system permease protein [Giesbergeria anulus]